MSAPARTRQRKAEDLSPPAGSDDPAERKRVLNVLAQRRYRKRKRDHVKALESQMNGKIPVHAEAPTEPAVRANNRSPVEDDPASGTNPLPEPSNTQPLLEASPPGGWLGIHGITTASQTCTDAASYPPHGTLYSDMREMSLESIPQSQPTINFSDDAVTANFLTQQQATGPGPSMLDWVVPSAFDNRQAYPPSHEPQPSAWTWDPLTFMPSVSLPSTPGPGSSSAENEPTPPSDPSSTSSASSSPTPPKAPLPPGTLSDYASMLQTYQTTHHTFPDTSSIRFHELDLLRGFLSIASLFNLSGQMWSLEATSPLCSPNPPPLPPNLPKNLHPTCIQLTIPHHPILDILPWSVTRDKLILVFSSPPQLRPVSAQSDDALLDLVYDIEDSSEGLKIWGDSPYVEGNWELGSKVFKKWWWAFDGEILRRSNEWRKERGASRLGMGTVLGEVDAGGGGGTS